MDSLEVDGGRKVYSANHCASCCALNSTRLLPAYIEGMWYIDTDNSRILSNLYGSCELAAEINGQNINISESTEFLFSDKVYFTLTSDSPVSFDFVLRLPKNSGDVKLKTGGNPEIIYEKDHIVIKKESSSEDTLEVDFSFEISKNVQHDGVQAYYSWGGANFRCSHKEQRNFISPY